MIFAPIEEIRVYRKSAVVRRKASVSLTAGTNELILSGISRSADPDSLRLFFSAGVLGKDVQILPFAEAVGRLPSADCEEKISELQNSIGTLKTLEDLWISNGSFTGCSKDGVERYLEALPARLEELREKKRELLKQLEEQQKEKETLERKEAFSVIRLVLECAEACEAVCEMEYTELSAGWIGTYEIHTAADSDKICVVSRGRITQNTGENWENVLVRLYTGNPTARQEIPALKKLSLQFRPEPQARAAGDYAASSAMMGSAMPGMAMAMAAPMQRMEMQEAEETDDETMTGFLLPGRRTVPSGTTGAMADLKTDGIPAEKRVVCIPKLDDCAYLAAIIKTADWPLKPSNAKIYLNENYCGEIYVDPDMTEETFMLSLGKDERIGLSRETVVSRTEDVLLKGQKRRTSEFAIRISNRQDQPLAVLVCDQIPVSTEKQIVVSHVSADGASIDEETGKLNWNLTVNGKTTVEKRLSYTVTYPKDKTLQEIQTAVKNGMRRCPTCGAYAQGKFCPTCGGVV